MVAICRRCSSAHDTISGLCGSRIRTRPYSSENLVHYAATRRGNVRLNMQIQMCSARLMRWCRMRLTPMTSPLSR